MKGCLTFLTICCVVLAGATEAVADWRDYVMARGYVRETPLVWKLPVYGLQHEEEDYQFTNLLNVRQTFRIYPSRSITLGIELKERAFIGSSARDLRQAADLYTIDETYFDWEWEVIREDQLVVSGIPDRLWFDVMLGDLQITAGRQRIAWGVNTAFNPTDLFNPASPLDFDNEEMPGTDALRAQYYLGPMSKLEAAVTPKRDADRTIAALKLQLNKWDYDWIWLLGRRYAQTVAGFSWAGDIHDAGFKGEILAAFPRDSVYNDDNAPFVSAGIGGDYAIPNTTVYLHAEVLYNQLGTTDKAGGMQLLQAFERKQLSPSRLDIFAEVTNTFSPLVSGNLNGIVNPYDLSWYAGPNVTISLLTNLDLTLMGMIYGGEDGTEFGDNPQMVMGRLKWNW